MVWAAEYGTWGGVRRLWQADNDNEDPNRGDLQGYDLDGNPVYAARLQTSGNLALKPLENPDPLFCPIRFQGQWADEESGLYYNRFRYYDPLSAQYMSPDPIGILGGVRSQSYVASPGKLVDPFGLVEKFYRVMSKSDCLQMKKTGKIPPSRKGETFISSNKDYVSQYKGHLVEIDAKDGTFNKMKTNAYTNEKKKCTKDMELIDGKKGWMKGDKAFFKWEKGNLNIGLGKGGALDKFNKSISGFIAHC